MGFTQATLAFPAIRAHSQAYEQSCQGVMDMKSLWTQTLAWILAIAVVILFALLGADPIGGDLFPHGSETPR